MTKFEVSVIKELVDSKIELAEEKSLTLAELKKELDKSFENIRISAI